MPTIKLTGVPPHLFHNVVAEAVRYPRLLSHENIDFHSNYLPQFWNKLQRTRTPTYHGDLLILEVIT